MINGVWQHHNNELTAIKLTWMWDDVTTEDTKRRITPPGSSWTRWMTAYEMAVELVES